MSPSGRLMLDRIFVQASDDTTDYVLIHEHCQTAESPSVGAIFELLEQVVYDWE